MYHILSFLNVLHIIVLLIDFCLIVYNLLLCDVLRARRSKKRAFLRPRAQYDNSHTRPITL